MRAAWAYLRVSSKSQTLESQRQAVERCALARGDTLAHVATEKLSGASLERPVLGEVRAAARRGELARLYVFRLDRLTRSGIRDTLAVVQELREHGCEVVSVADGFSLGGPGGEIVLAVLAWAAQQERAALGERITAARERVEREGGHWGRPRAVVGGQVERIHGLRAEGWSLRLIAQWLGVSYSTVRAVLSGKGPYAERRKTPRKKATPAASE